MRPLIVSLSVALIIGATVPAEQPANAANVTPAVPYALVSSPPDPPAISIAPDAEIVAERIPAPLIEAAPIADPPLPPIVPPPPVELTIRERALAQLERLGATERQLIVFDCIGWYESGWQSKRSNQRNADGTYDHGPFQINDVHRAQLAAQNLDPYNPEDAATYVWQLSRQGRIFTAWAVHTLCGV